MTTVLDINVSNYDDNGFYAGQLVGHATGKKSCSNDWQKFAVWDLS